MKLKIVILLIIATLISCQKQPSGIDYSYDVRPVAAFLIYQNKEDSCNLYFNRTSVAEGTIEFRSIYYYYCNCDDFPNYRHSVINGIFEINKNTKPFSEWNECSIGVLPDTTKSQVFKFKFEGKNIPTNISFLYDLENNIGDTLVFFDSVNNIRYYFRKYIR